MSRAVIDLDQQATVLDLAERISAAGADQELVVVAAAGAPWLRNAVFIEVGRTLAGVRPFALVTSDQRARSLAASVHVPAYSSVAALDRRELDATERLLRRSRPQAARQARLHPPVLTRRGLAVLASLAAAALLVLAVVVPEATVVVAPTTRPLGPLELQLRAGPAGEIPRQELSETLTARVQGAATGSREEQLKAKGTVQLSNRQTRSIRIPKSTLFRTPDGIGFEATEERTLPASVIFGPVPLTIGTVTVPVEAVAAGAQGNVAAGRITVSPAANDYVVNNAQPTTGGEVKKIPVVQRSDYAAAVSTARVAPAINERAQSRLAEWRSRPPSGTYVVPRVYTSAPTSVTPESEVVGKEVTIFDLSVTFVATAFAVTTDEPRKTAVGRLRGATDAGYALAETSVQYDESLLPDPTNSGVIAWAVTVSGSQLARVDTDGIRRSLAGRGLDEVAGTLERSGVRLVELRREPAWWPRVPLLDARIRVSEVPATAPR